MRNVGDEIALEHFVARQFPRHGVEILDEHFQLVLFSIPADRRNLHAEIARRHLARRLGQDAQRLADAIAPKHAEQHGQQNACTHHIVRQHDDQGGDLIQKGGQNSRLAHEQQVGDAEDAQRDFPRNQRRVHARVVQPFARPLHFSTAL